MGNSFSGPVTVFHGLLLLVKVFSVRYAALIDAYRLPAHFRRITSFLIKKKATNSSYKN